MLRLRPYLPKDTDTILSWCRDEETFYKWTAGVMGEYPITREKFAFVDSMIAFCAMDETGIIGFFTMRNPKPTLDELRIGFVIVDPEKRGRGYGREMLKLALQYAKEIYKAKVVSLAVFDNNPNAHRCYLSAGFRDIPQNPPETYQVRGETWNCIQMECDLLSFQ